MTTYVITSPDGKKYKVTGEGSKEDALAHLQAQLGQQPAENTGDTPEMAARRRQGLDAAPPAFNPGVAGYDPQTGNVDSIGPGGTFLGSMAEGVPIAGPALDQAGKMLGAAVAAWKSGEPFGKVKKRIDSGIEQAREDHPVARIAGNVAGSIGALGPIGATESGGWALGVNGPSLLGRVGMSAASGGAINAADTAARGGDVEDVLTSGGIGAGFGVALPVVGAGISKGLGAASDSLGSFINSIKNPASEAERRLGAGMVRDAGTAMTPADEAVARANNVPLINADRGGETVRALARSAANQSPEARGAIEKLASDRFAGQSRRAADFVRKLYGGNPDDLALQDSIDAAARRVNKPAYDAAYNAPEAQAMWTPELQQLMQAPAMRRAAQQSTTRGANRAAVDGFQAIKNPFHQASDGTSKLTRRADGTLVAPTLQFWDQVKRNLDGLTGKAQRAGDNTLAADMTALKKKLVENLDAAVPQYKSARQGAAAFFGAEDALDAGRKFVMQKGAVPEARRAFAKFSAPEQKAFQTGFASELIDRILKSPDRMNVINQTFKSEATRDQFGLVFGAHKMREVEAYVRVEDLVDRVRGAMGNSTTARQLVELGIGGGAGFALTGDWKGALAGAALVRGPRFVKGKIEESVLRELGKLLTKDDPALMNRIVHNASLSKPYMKALENLGAAIQVTGQATAPKLAQ